MRIRTTKPEFWSSVDVGSISRDARLLFLALWNYADDFGRATADCRVLKAFAFPFDDDIIAEPTKTVDDSSTTIRRLLDELSHADLIALYTHGSRALFQVTGWQHQKIDRYKESKIPPPPEHEWEPVREKDAPVTQVKYVRRRTVVDESSIVRRFVDDASSPDHGSVEDQYLLRVEPEPPHREAEQHARRSKSTTPTERTRLFDAMAELAGFRPDDDLTKTQGSRIGKVVADLVALRVIADDVPAMIAKYRKKNPGLPLLPETFAKHAPTLRTMKPLTSRREGTWLDGGDPTRTPTQADITAGRFVEPSRFGGVA